MRIENIIITAIDREPEYIHQTLATMSLGGLQCPVHIMVDGPTCKYYETYKDLVHFHFHEPQGEPGWKRAGINYARCLKKAKGTCSLIIENDVIFCKDWWNKLVEIELPNEACVLDIINFFPNVPTGHNYNKFIGDKISEKGHEVWCRTPGVVYNGAYLPLDELAKFICSSYPLVYDLAIGSYFAINKTPIYFPFKPLITSIGEVTTLMNLKT